MGEAKRRKTLGLMPKQKTGAAPQNVVNPVSRPKAGILGVMLAAILGNYPNNKWFK